MIEGVSRPLYDGYTHQTDLQQFLVSHGMQQFSTTAMPATTFPSVQSIEEIAHVNTNG